MSREDFLKRARDAKNKQRGGGLVKFDALLPVDTERLEKAIGALQETLGLGIDFNNIDELIEKLGTINNLTKETTELKEAIRQLHIPELPETIKIEGIGDFIEALKKLKVEAPTININNDNIAKAIVLISKKLDNLAKATKANSASAKQGQTVDDFIPVRRVIMVGNSLQFDDNSGPGGNGSRGSIGYSGVPTVASTTDSTKTVVPIGNYDGSPISAGAGGGGDASAANQTLQITEATTTNTNLGAKADSAASTDTGTFSLIALFKRLLQGLTTLNAKDFSTATKQGDGSQKTQVVDSLNVEIGSTIKTNTDGFVAPAAGGYVRQDSTGTIAKETGGNLATVKTNTDGFVTAAGGGYVRQDSTGTIAKETGGNLASIKTNSDTIITDLGGVTETAPATDTASSGLNGRLQRIAQRLTSLIALLPTSLGQKTMTNSLAVTLASDQASVPVAATLTAETTKVIGTVRNLGNAGAAFDAATGASAPANALYNGSLARTSPPTAVSNAQVVAVMADIYGKQIVRESLREDLGNQATTITSSTSETTIVTADATYKLDIYALIISNTSATGCKVTIKDSTAGTTRFILYIPANDVRGFSLSPSGAHKQNAANNNWTATCGTSVASIEITALFTRSL